MPSSSKKSRSRSRSRSGSRSGSRTKKSPQKSISSSRGPKSSTQVPMGRSTTQVPMGRSTTQVPMGRSTTQVPRGRSSSPRSASFKNMMLTSSRKNEVVEVSVNDLPLIPYYFIQKNLNIVINDNVYKNLKKHAELSDKLINGKRLDEALASNKNPKETVETYMRAVRKAVDQKKLKVESLSGGARALLPRQSRLYSNSNSSSNNRRSRSPSRSRRNNEPKNMVENFIDLVENKQNQKALSYFIILVIIIATTNTAVQKILDFKHQDIMSTVDADTIVDSFTQIVIAVLHLLGYFAAGSAVVKVLTSRGETIEIKTERSNFAAITSRHPMANPSSNPYHYQDFHPIQHAPQHRLQYYPESQYRGHQDYQY